MKHGLIVKTENTNRYLAIPGEADHLQANHSFNGHGEYFYCVNPVLTKTKGSEIVNPQYFKQVEKVVIPFLLNESARKDYSKRHADAVLRDDRRKIKDWCKTLLQDFHLGEISIRDAGDDVYCIITLPEPVKKDKEEFINKFHGFLSWLSEKYSPSPFNLYSISDSPVWNVRLLSSRNPHIYGIPKTTEETFFLEGGNDFTRFILEERAIKPKDEIEKEIDEYNRMISIETVLKKWAKECFTKSKSDSANKKILWLPCPIAYLRTGQMEDEYNFFINIKENTFRDEHSAQSGSPLDLINTLLHFKKKKGKIEKDFVKYITKEDFIKNKDRIINITQESEEIREILEREDGYYKLVKGKTWVSFTNFTMKLIKKVEVAGVEETKRTFRLRNNREERTIEIDSKTMSDPGRFKTRIQSVGDFFFRGNATDLTTMFELVCQKANIPVVTGIGQYGYFNKNEKHYYITDNLLITKNGFYPIYRDGNFYVDGERFCLSLDPNLPGGVDNIRMEYKPQINDEIKRLLDILLSKIPQSRGNKQFVLAFGWLFATPFAEIIKKEYDYRFPFLFINGMTNEGKSKLGELMTYFSGFVPHSGIDIQDTSATAFKQSICAYNSFPLFFDQFELNKNPEKRREYEDMLKGLYDASYSNKSSPSGQMRSITPQNVCLCIAGEEMTQSAASRNRTVQIQMSRNQQDRSAELYNTILDNQGRYTLLMSHYIRWIFSQNIQKRIDSLRGISKTLILRTQGSEVDREVKNYSVIVWGYKNILDFAEYYGVLTEKEKEGKIGEMWRVVGEAYKEQMQDSEEVKITTQFIEDLNVMAYKKVLRQNIDYWIITNGNKKIIALKFRNVWNEYTRYYRRATGSSVLFKQTDIRNALKNEGISLGSYQLDLPTRQQHKRTMLTKGHFVMKIDPSKPYPGAWRDFVSTTPE